MSDVDFTITSYDAPAAVELVAELQDDLAVRYGSGDETPVEPAEFAFPVGIFLIGSDGENALACGGIRLTTPGVAELKRMYVRPSARRQGIARLLLARLEDEARALGAAQLRLETGLGQPEAVAMYRSAGYDDTEPFGHYADTPGSVHLAKRL